MDISEYLKNFDPEKTPAWVSVEARETAKYLVKEDLNYYTKGIPNGFDDWPEKEKKKLLVKHTKYADLFCDLRMRSSWEEMAKLGVDGVKGQVWFACALWESLPGFIGTDLTLKESEEWKKDLSSLLLKARDMLLDNPSSMESIAGAFSDDLNNMAGSSQPVFLHMPEVLNLMDSAVKATNPDSGFRRNHVRSPTAHRGVFIRKLTCALYQATGEPHSKIVTNAAIVAYETDLDERSVTRTTEGLDWKNQPLVVSFSHKQ